MHIQTAQAAPGQHRKPDLLNTTEAADYLQLRVNTLEIWRSTGRYGLPYIRVGRSIRYRRSDLDEFLRARTVSGEAA